MNAIVENYGWTSAEATGASEYLVPCVLSILRGLNVRRVLDIGAGNGFLCGELAKAGFEVVGVEADFQGVAIARQAYPEVQFYQLSVEAGPGDLLKQELPFDAVVSTEVIEHLFSPHLLPTFAHAVLKPGGHLVVSTPYHGYLKNLALSILGKWDRHLTALWHGGHIKFWSKRTLSQLLQDAGFAVTSFRGVGRVAFLWKSMILTAAKPLPSD